MNPIAHELLCVIFGALTGLLGWFLWGSPALATATAVAGMVFAVFVLPFPRDPS